VHVDRISLGPLETNCWVVGEEESGPVAVIDPGGDAPRLLEFLNGREVEVVFLTHAHFDHVGAAGALVEATGATVCIHAEDAGRLATDAAHGTGGALFGFPGVVAPEPDRLLSDGDTVQAAGMEFTVLHTPGHTRGGVCLLVCPEGSVPHLFSGDTLFAGSVGRTDFPGGDARALSRSIAEKLAPLHPDTVVHPGHGPDTTIAREMRVNPFWPRA
jgi:glyoxylase-like metal-dependent hydrolase (beta-lactamase superfamily II)